MAHDNPKGDAKYEPTVKSPNNNTTTGTPGEKSAIAHSPSRAMTYEAQRKLENKNYSDPVQMTGKLSAPAAEKGTLPLVGTGVKLSTDGKGAMGQVKGGDPMGYLGHFRSPKVLECGHNQGAPGGTLPVTPTPGPAIGGGGMGVSTAASAPRPMMEGGGGFGTPATPGVGAVRKAVSPGMARSMLSGAPGRTRAVNVGGGTPATTEAIRAARPVVAARADKRAAVQSAKQAGAPAAEIRGIRQTARENIRGAKQTVRRAKKAGAY